MLYTEEPGVIEEQDDCMLEQMESLVRRGKIVKYRRLSDGAVVYAWPTISVPEGCEPYD
jgi:hypothetical protein